MPETTDTTAETVAPEQTITVVEPEKKFIDETEGIEVGEFEKIIEEPSVEDGVMITTRKIVPMGEDEIISSKTKALKIKVAL